MSKHDLPTSFVFQNQRFQNVELIYCPRSVLFNWQLAEWGEKRNGAKSAGAEAVWDTRITHAKIILLPAESDLEIKALCDEAEEVRE